MTAQTVGLGAYLPAGQWTDTVRPGRSPDRGFRLGQDKAVTTGEAGALTEAFDDARAAFKPHKLSTPEVSKEDGFKGRHLDVRA